MVVEERQHGSARAGAGLGRHHPASASAPVAAGATGWPGGLVVAGLGAAGAVVAVSGALDHISIVADGLVGGFVAAAAVGLAIGVAGRALRWWATWGAGIAVAAAVVVAAAYSWIRVTGLVTDHYPPTFLLWVWLALVACGVAVTGWWSGGVAVRVVRVVAAPLAVLTAFLLINQHYGYWPTVSVLLDKPVTGQVSGSTIAGEIHLRNASARDLVPTRVPKVGQYGPVVIRDTPVPFIAKKAWVWLPPAYFRYPDRQLPVLMMLPGWPGNVQDWVKAGQVVGQADSWAAAHDGVAPIMIMVDENGLHGRDTECVNGPRGLAASYLTRDVPRWAHRTLGIRPDWRTWGVVGFSEGGTCAVGLASEYPGLFGHFVDMSGDGAPNHGNVAKTLQYLYGGNQAAARLFQPKLLLTTRHYPHLDGWFAAGSADRHGRRVAAILANLARNAGVGVHTYLGSGGHSWTFARDSFAAIYPSLVSSMAATAQLSPPTCPTCSPRGHHARRGILGGRPAKVRGLPANQ